ncbi:MAG: HIT domain-containing protein [Spirochaetaceae bacterium]|nr:HIT domain-containing protein [Spirochaetaceae bacterium]
MSYFFSFDKMKYVRGPRPSGCILCLIRDKSSEVIDLTVYSDKLFTVCVNLYPYNPGHVMIFPNRHLVDVRELTTAEDRLLSELTRRFLNVIESTHSPVGFNIGYNMGSSAGASIDHLHLHVIPRYPKEIGIADLIAGKRVLIEDPRVTQARLIDAVQRTDLS